LFLALFSPPLKRFWQKNNRTCPKWLIRSHRNLAEIPALRHRSATRSIGASNLPVRLQQLDPWSPPPFSLDLLALPPNAPISDGNKVGVVAAFSALQPFRIRL
jgi:hypothetical protein